MKTQQIKLSKRILFTMVSLGVMLGGSQVLAAEKNLEEFTLAQMVVTATRTIADAQKVPLVLQL